jgi:hypothetical protein
MPNRHGRNAFQTEMPDKKRLAFTGREERLLRQKIELASIGLNEETFKQQQNKKSLSVILFPVAESPDI